MVDASIKQRIALEGVAEIQKQLRDLGVSGESAFKQIKDAVDKQNLAKPAADFKKIGESLSGLSEKMREFAGVSEAGLGAVAGLAGKLGPVGAALGAIVVGFAALGKTASEKIVETDRLARGLGFTVEQYQGLQRAARDAGVEQEKFTAGMSRFVRQTAGEGREQFTSLVDIAKKVSTEFSAVGFGSGQQNPLQSYLEIRKTVEPVIQQLRGVFAQAAQQSPGTQSGRFFEQLNKLPDVAFSDRVAKMAVASKEFRDELAKIGAISPPTGPLENLDQLIKRSQPTLAALGISAIDSSGKIKSTFDTLSEWVAKVGAIKDPAEQTRRVFEMFGRQSAQFVKFVQEGLSGLPHILESLKGQGLLISPEELERAQALRKEWIDLEESGTALRKTISEPFISPFAEVLKGANDLLQIMGPGGTLITAAGLAAGAMALAFGPVGAVITGIAAALIGVQAALDKLKGVSPNFAPEEGNVGGAAAFSGGATGGLLNNGNIQRFFAGGLIRGAGTGTSDSILARFASGGMIRVSNGEYISDAATVQRLGVPFFAGLKQLGSTAKFASGGLLGGLQDSLGALALPRFADGGLVPAMPHIGTVDLRTNAGDLRMMIAHDTLGDLQKHATRAAVARGGTRQSWAR